MVNPFTVTGGPPSNTTAFGWEPTADGMRHRELVRALDSLNPRMRRVVALRFGLDGEKPQTLEEVGAGLAHNRR